jgi:hypothetical protein
LIINVIIAVLLEVLVLLQRNTALDYFSLVLVLSYVILSTVGHGLSAILIQLGFSQQEADAIAEDVENAASTLQTVSGQENHVDKPAS